MLELMRQCGDGDRLYKVGRAYVLIDDTVRIGHQQIEHLRIVARCTGGDAARGGCRKQVTAEKEPSDIEVLTRRRELIHRACEEKDLVLILVHVRRRAEVDAVDGKNEGIEGSTEIE